MQGLLHHQILEPTQTHVKPIRDAIQASHSWKQPLSVDFPGGSDGKVSAYNAGDTGSVGPTTVRTC